MAVDLMINACKAFETLIGTACMPICANVHPHLTYLSRFLFSLSSGVSNSFQFQGHFRHI